MQVKGEQVANSKLTADQVIAIRENRIKAMWQREELNKLIHVSKIAEAHGVAERTVWDLLDGTTWKHL